MGVDIMRKDRGGRDEGGRGGWGWVSLLGSVSAIAVIDCLLGRKERGGGG